MCSIPRELRALHINLSSDPSDPSDLSDASDPAVCGNEKKRRGYATGRFSVMWMISAGARVRKGNQLPTPFDTMSDSRALRLV